MQSWMFLTFVAILTAGVFKLLSGSASGIKRRMDALHLHDPVIDALAWLDRVTTLHRH